MPNVLKKHIVYISIVFALISCGQYHLSKSKGAEQIEIVEEQNSQKDTSLQAIINPYRIQLKQEMDSIIGEAEHSMEKNRPESDLGNFVADLTFEVGKKYLQESNLYDSTKTFCLLNTGGLRSIISKGDITVGDCYTLMPFNNEVVIVKIEGSKVLEVIDYLEKSGGEPISNLNVVYNEADGIGNNILAKVGLSDIEKDKHYYVITSDYLAKGGDNMTFFNNPVEYIQLGTLLRDAIINKVKSMKEPISVGLDGRIKFVKYE